MRALAVAVVAMIAFAAAPAASARPPVPGQNCTFSKGVTACRVLETRTVVDYWVLVGGDQYSFVARDCPTYVGYGYEAGPYAGYYNVTYAQQRTLTTLYRGAKKVIARTATGWSSIEVTQRFTGACFRPSA